MVGGSSLEGFTVSSANKVMVRRHILLGVRMHGKGVVLMFGGPSGVATWRLGKIQVSLEGEGYAELWAVI